MRTEKDRQKRQVREERNTSWGVMVSDSHTASVCPVCACVIFTFTFKTCSKEKRSQVSIFILWWKRFPVFIHVNAENISLAITAIIWEGIKTHHRLLALEKVLSTLKERKEELLDTKYTQCLPGVWGAKHYKNSLKWWSTGQVPGWQ